MKFKAMALLFGVIVFLSAITLPFGTSEAKTIDLKFSSPWPPQHPQHTMVIAPWGEKIKELSGGRATVTLFPGQALGKAADQYDMAVKGVCDIALTISQYTPGRFHLLSSFWLPFMVTSAEDTSVALWKAYDKYFQKEFADVKVLWMYVHAPGQIFTREKPIKTLDDFKGMKIRATNPPVQESLKLLGASPVAIPVPEVYNALERGVVDGTAMPFEGLFVFKQHEVVKYGVICDLYTMTFPIVMNKAKYESLPADIRKIIDDTTGLEMSRKAGVVYDKVEAVMKQKVLDSGIEVNDLPKNDMADWKRKGQKIREEWIKEMTDEGAPAEAILQDIETMLGTP